MKIIPPKRSGDGYRKYKPTFCRSREASYPKAPHPFVVQVTVLAVGPAQIALIRAGLAAKSLAAGSLDVSCSTSRSETGTVGFEGVNQIDDSELGRTDWGPVVVPALVAIRAFWWHQSWCFLLKVFKVFKVDKVDKDQLNYLGIFDAGNDFDLAMAVFTDLNIDVQDSLWQWHNACHI